MKCVRQCVAFWMGFLLALVCAYKFLFLVCRNKEKKIAKFRKYFNTLDKWLGLNRKKFLLKNFLLQNNYKSVAIYGIGIMGKQLLEELRGGEIDIVYSIDANRKNDGLNIPVKTLDDDLEEVDIIIVTPSFDFEEIKAKLEMKVSCPIISLEQLIGEWYEECGAVQERI